VEQTKPDRVTTYCPLAGPQIHQGTGRTARHPIQILAEAYGLDSEISK
jgi:Fe-S oxidoreductase